MDDILSRLDALEQWKADREHQQLVAPLDDVSRAVLHAATGLGFGSKLKTQSISVATTPPSNITVPAAYSGTLILVIEGAQYEVPFL